MNKTVEDCVVDCVISLDRAMQHGGGGILTLEELKKTNLYDFIKIIAPNGIRFVHDRNLVLNEPVRDPNVAPDLPPVEEKRRKVQPRAVPEFS